MGHLIEDNVAAFSPSHAILKAFPRRPLWWLAFRLIGQKDPLVWFAYSKPAEPGYIFVDIDGLPWMVHAATRSMRAAGHRIEQGFAPKSELAWWRTRRLWTVATNRR